MLYRIYIDLAFTDLDPILDIRDKCLDALDQAHTINPDSPDEEKGYIKVIKCFHDENPHNPCEILEEQYTS